MDVPVGELAGVSGRRARWWRLLSVFVGLLAAVGLFALTCGDRAPVDSVSLFTERITTLDYYFLGVVGVGLIFLEVAVLSLRRSRYPRTDGAGAALVGAMLCTLGGVFLFARLWAVGHG